MPPLITNLRNDDDEEDDSVSRRLVNLNRTFLKQNWVAKVANRNIKSPSKIIDISFLKNDVTQNALDEFKSKKDLLL